MSGMDKDQAHEAWAFSPHTCPVHENDHKNLIQRGMEAWKERHD